VPSTPQVPSDPVHFLRWRHDAEGLVIHAKTAMPGWMGERLNVAYAIDVLHPLANPTCARPVGDKHYFSSTPEARVRS
jgi:hypothetical protein